MNAAALEDSSEVYPVPQKVMSDYAEFPVKSAGISFVPLFDEAPDEAVNWGIEQYLSTVGALQQTDYDVPKFEVYVGNKDNAKIKSFFGDLQLPEQGYAIKVMEKTGDSVKIALTGADSRGIFYGIMSLKQLLSGSDGKAVQRVADIVDYPVWPNRFICDYFGNITEEWINFYASQKIAGIAGLSDSNWRSPEWWKQVEPTLQAMKRAKDMNLMTIMAQLHIYHSGRKMNIAKEEEIDEFIVCCRRMIENGATYLMIAADDSTPRDVNGYRLYYPEETEKFKSAGEAHGYLMKRIYEALHPEYPDVHIAMVGAPYSLAHGIGEPHIDEYVRDWAAIAPEEVVWIWTGPEVCSSTITKTDHEIMERLLGTHKLYLFDNSNSFFAPMPRWETKFYNGMEKDDNGIVFLLGLGCGWRPWETVYFLGAGDYLWNPHNYDPLISYSEAVRKVYGKEGVEPVNKLWSSYVACLEDFNSGNRVALAAKLPEAKRDYDNAAEMTFKDKRKLDLNPVKNALDSMTVFATTQVPILKVPKVRGNITMDGIIALDEWSGAADFQLTGDNDTSQVNGKALYDDDGIFFAFDIRNDADLPPLQEQPRDSAVYLTLDSVEIFLQPSAMGAYGHFGFDYAGNRFDEPNDEGGFMWNPEWQVHVKRQNGGWQAELFIPTIELEQLAPKKPAPGVMWRVNFHRVDGIKNQIFSWSKGGMNFHVKQFFGDLIFE